jgi:hypothetical protein
MFLIIDHEFVFFEGCIQNPAFLASIDGGAAMVANTREAIAFIGAELAGKFTYVDSAGCRQEMNLAALPCAALEFFEVLHAEERAARPCVLVLEVEERKDPANHIVGAYAPRGWGPF